VLPADGSKVGTQRFRDHFAAATQVIERTVEIYGVPERDSGGDEGKPARTVLLRLDRTIAQPAEAVETDSAGEGVARFALVEFHGRLPPQSWQLEPVEHEQRALDPSDFAKGQRQAILAGISSQALEEERSADRSGANRCREAQDIIPVGRDQLSVDAPGDERFEHRPSACWSKGVEAPLCQVGNARGEIEAEQICQGEVVIADGAAIGVMRSDAQVGLVVEQAVDDIGGFAGRRDRNRMVGRLASREVRIESADAVRS